MSIQFDDFHTIKYGEMVSSIIFHALKAVDPEMCVKNNVQINKNSIKIIQKDLLLADIQKILLIGFGKAALSMAAGLPKELLSHIHRGLLITKHMDMSFQSRLPENIEVCQGSHPIPSEKSISATQKIIDLLDSVTDKDLVLTLISGGGSALMTFPHHSICLKELQNLTDLLIRSGAKIEEINTVRKHLDLIKGGGLLKYIWPSTSITLILSDVIGDSISMIASGPTTADPTTFQQAMDIIKNYGLEKQVERKIIQFLESGINGKIEETIKYGSKFLERNENFIIGSLTLATKAAQKEAQRLGFDSEIITTTLTGEARDKGSWLGQMLKNKARKMKSEDKPICLIAGGETTVTVRGIGKGGRNQELALAAAMEIDGLSNCLIVTFATDGEDGPTDAAGAIVTGNTIERGVDLGLNAHHYLINNDVYHYFEQTGELFRSGPTGTNVNDLALLFVFKSDQE